MLTRSLNRQRFFRGSNGVFGYVPNSFLVPGPPGADGAQGPPGPGEALPDLVPVDVVKDKSAVVKRRDDDNELPPAGPGRDYYGQFMVIASTLDTDAYSTGPFDEGTGTYSKPVGVSITDTSVAAMLASFGSLVVDGSFMGYNEHSPTGYTMELESTQALLHSAVRGCMNNLGVQSLSATIEPGVLDDTVGMCLGQGTIFPFYDQPLTGPINETAGVATFTWSFRGRITGMVARLIGAYDPFPPEPAMETLELIVLKGNMQTTPMQWSDEGVNEVSRTLTFNLELPLAAGKMVANSILFDETCDDTSAMAILVRVPEGPSTQIHAHLTVQFQYEDVSETCPGPVMV